MMFVPECKRQYQHHMCYYTIHIIFFRSYSGKYHFVAGDLRHPAAIEDLCKAITDIYPKGIDILINNAGAFIVAFISK